MWHTLDVLLSGGDQEFLTPQAAGDEGEANGELEKSLALLVFGCWTGAQATPEELGIFVPQIDGDESGRLRRRRRCGATLASSAASSSWIGEGLPHRAPAW